jgi:hypothetical protein
MQQGGRHKNTANFCEKRVFQCGECQDYDGGGTNFSEISATFIFGAPNKPRHMPEIKRLVT